MYTIAFVDRNNIGLAIPSMSKSLHVSPTISGLVFGIFFVGYLILQIPGGHLAERWSAKWYVFIALLAWGVLASITGLVQNVTQLLIIRFLLGVVEGGVWPATLVLLAHWFPRRERARANGLWMLCLPVASAASSPISGYILASTGDYRIMFVAEGAPAIVWAILWAIFIKDHPRQSASPEAEREYLATTLAAERQDRDRPDLGTYKKALTSPLTWLFCLIYFFSTIPGYGISSFLPSLLKQTGMSIGTVGIINALPYVVAIVGLLVVGAVSDRTMFRRRWVAIPALIMGVGIILSAVLHASTLVSIVLLIAAGFGLYSYLAPFWATVDQMMPAAIAGGAMGLINGIGNLGGFAGPYVVGYLDSTTGGFITGFIFLGACALAMAPLIMLAKLREGPAATATTAPTPDPAKGG